MRTDKVPHALNHKWASRRQVAAELAVSIATVDRMVTTKRLKSRLYIGGRVFISRESIKAILAEYLR